MRRSHITVLAGGASAESAVSRVSGGCVAEVLADDFEVDLLILTEDILPQDLMPADTVVFPAMHGDFGEDGKLQALLEDRGFAYAGSGPLASALCMDKIRSKRAVAGSGFRCARDLVFPHDEPPGIAAACAATGKFPVLKPADKGSSVGLVLPPDEDGLRAALANLTPGVWMLEERIDGREMTIGLLDGEALGIVEIFPEGGVYDYARKYTGGTTRYEFPARVDHALARQLGDAAEAAYTACGCRDFARVDFILRGEDAFFLEINTIPGLTPTSLLPKSASCRGINFKQLARRMIEPAFARFVPAAAS